MEMALALALALGGAGVPDSARVPRVQQPAGFWSLRLDLAAPGTPAPPSRARLNTPNPEPTFPMLAREGRQGGGGLSGGARSRGKDAGGRRARASGGHERSRLARRHLDRRANNELSPAPP
eukprot:gene17382-35833_t